MRNYHRLLLFWLSFLNSCLLLRTASAQSLMVKVSNLPPSGSRIQILCDLEGILVYRVQFDYTPGTAVVTKEINLPVATGYRLRAAATKGLGKLPLIIGTGKAENVNIGKGSQEATIALGIPRAQLVPGVVVQGARTVVFHYDETAALLQVGDPATLWCTDNVLKTNTAGRTIIAPIKIDFDSSLYATFAIPNSDVAKYCQAGYYSTHFTLADQIPVFVYPDLASGAMPLNITSIPVLGQGPSAMVESSIAPATSAGPAPVKERTITTVRTGKDGHLERVRVGAHE